MVRFGHVVMAYFVMGAVMWGGGAIMWGDAGLGAIIVDQPAAGGVNDQTVQDLEDAGGPIQNALSQVGAGALIAVWNLVVKFFGFLTWPMTVLANGGAPPRVWVLLGGTPTMAFYTGVIRLIRTSG